MSFWLVFLLMGRKAKQSGIVGDKKKSGRTLVQSIRYWCVEFDCTATYRQPLVSMLIRYSNWSSPHMRRLLHPASSFYAGSSLGISVYLA
jgi:hypothetical protein